MVSEKHLWFGIARGYLGSRKAPLCSCDKEGGLSSSACRTLEYEGRSQGQKGERSVLTGKVMGGEKRGEYELLKNWRREKRWDFSGHMSFWGLMVRWGSWLTDDAVT